MAIGNTGRAGKARSAVSRKPDCAMGPRDDGSARRRRAAPLAAALALSVGFALAGGSSRSYAGEWTVEPSLSLGATLTDNVSVAPPGQEESDLVITALPVIRVRGEGGRVEGSLAYAPAINTYVNSTSDSDIRHNLVALGTLEAVKNFFFVDARANASQVSNNPFGPAPTVNTSTESNRIQSYSYGISPYVQGVTRYEITYLARYDALWSNFDSSGGNLYEGTVTTRLTGPRNRRLGWTAEYLRNDRDFSDLQGNFSDDIGRLILDYELVPTLRVEARGGYESNNYTEIGGHTGAVYGGGLSWTPSPRTSVNGFAERRFFGTGYNLDASYRTRLTAWRVHGSRNSTTTPQQLAAARTGGPADLLDAAFAARFPDPVQRQAIVTQTLNQLGLSLIPQNSNLFVAQQIFVSEEVGASAALTGKRNTIVFAVFWNKNTPLTSPDQPLSAFGFDRPFEQKGGSLSYTLRLSAISSVNALVSRTRTTSDPTFAVPVGQSSTDNLFRVAYNRALGPRTDGFVGARYRKFKSTTQVGGDAEEHALFFGVSHRWY